MPLGPEYMQQLQSLQPAMRVRGASRTAPATTASNAEYASNATKIHTSAKNNGPILVCVRAVA